MAYSFEAGAAIDAYRFVKFDGATVKPASASTDKIIGVTDSINYAEGDMADVHLPGAVTEVQAGGTFYAGDALTADSNGKAVAATSGDNIGAIALNSAVSGDIVKVVIVAQQTIAAQTQATTEPTTEATSATEPTEPTTPSSP